MSPEPQAALDIEIPARDGYPLAASVFGDVCSAGRVAIISSATAVPRQYYRHYAGAMRDAGYAVISYDYRGIGDSKPASLRGFRAQMRDWVFLDMSGVLDWVRAQNPAAGIYLVGHSAGGQLAGLLDDVDNIRGMISVSAQSGHWRLQGGEQKLAVAFHVYLTLPLLAKLLGYVPWSWFGPAADLPGGVALEWSRWCRDPLYLLGDSSLPLERYRQFRAPVLACDVADDKWGTREAVDAMSAAYPNVERRHLVAADCGLRHLGHFGFFRRTASSLWRDGFAWLGDC